MYFIYEVEEWVGVSPSKAYQVEDLDSIVLEQLREDLEGKVDDEMGIIVAVLEARVMGDGIILPLGGDPDIYFPVRYKLLAFRPVLLEVVRAVVSRVENFGLTLNLGPIEGKVHRSQVMDENVELTPDGSAFRGVSSKREIRAGDVVRARVINVSRPSRTAQILQIGLTMRQPYLGKEEWLKAEAARAGGGK